MYLEKQKNRDTSTEASNIFRYYVEWLCLTVKFIGKVTIKDSKRCWFDLLNSRERKFYFSNFYFTRNISTYIVFGINGINGIFILVPTALLTLVSFSK